MNGHLQEYELLHSLDINNSKSNAMPSFLGVFGILGEGMRGGTTELQNEFPNFMIENDGKPD